MSRNSISHWDMEDLWSHFNIMLKYNKFITKVAVTLLKSNSINLIQPTNVTNLPQHLYPTMNFTIQSKPKEQNRNIQSLHIIKNPK